ncbi:division/outer membrane stress-associated lipid-binding lipoprotein [Colwellia sp. 4_MG-2023]|jgi:osmotically-inducible protein OsmY|uniref:division/outer membrane stress-associated lipid-binding lipoprotein n=1 Tax=unclassified Colwellia TaxID=196834 RepID=UPI001C07FECB|nr:MULTISPECIES: division/outer membrane stress-associated lipid-binding lipoprotein [unclassified Colwellia]MBU2926231.1 divisome-associated lipoprotein YraP [Colwellia sp. C2M11]MDO6489459.1 division/outer membrane stress-associated lipid-binding lipoprotein [Colwellia sp. 6_MG-2023]MDO6508477.1 division/outer membrane stress-associated lipid-binding lipoprotein [Colwellia sp. 5_MG-2023]MDO6557092.1 division/outer membrane stress-associated lipid-binding lipoprotein [Colwellia sp. 4_MG-2023]
MAILSKISKNRPTKIVSTLLLLGILQGCTAVTVVAITAGASMATDRRSIGNQIDDQTIQVNAYNRIAKNKALSDNTNLHLTSVNGSVLIIGQAPTTYLKDQAIKIISEIEGVVRVHNQIRIGSITSVTTRTNDIWLTSKVKTALFSDSSVNGKNIKVITENGEVFLMGIVSKKEADAAVNITRNISGVNKVFKAFEYI